MKFLTRDQVFGRVLDQGSVVFEKDDRPFNLNIIAIRSKAAKIDAFECQLMMAWKESGKWNDISYSISTYPGSYYLQRKLLNPKGCAILAPGQYRGVYALRLHNNKYEALCQTHGPVKIYRDKNKDSKFDFDTDNVHVGNFGINVHNTPDGRVTKKVFANSAGCLTFPDDNEFFEARDIWRESKEIFGNKFTLTLVKE